MMAERPLFTPRVRRGAWLRDPEGGWVYTARPERYADEVMFERPPQLAAEADDERNV